MKHPINLIEDHSQDQDLYVSLVNRLQSQRPRRRTRDNVVRFPGTAQQQEEPISDGLTTGGAAAILLTLLVLTAVLIALGAAG